jgi:hypothetical protein
MVSCIETAPTMTGRFRAWLVLALVALPPLAIPLPALAHAILLEGTPAAGQSVASGATRITLRFNSRIDAARSRITLVEGTTARILTIASGPTADLLVADVALQPGPQILRWQVLAVDGHITRGEIRFTAKPAP